MIILKKNIFKENTFIKIIIKRTLIFIKILISVFHKLLDHLPLHSYLILIKSSDDPFLYISKAPCGILMFDVHLLP